MTDYILRADSAHIKLSPEGFRLAARDYFKCFLDFEKPGRFSVVPFFLCCRAIELAVKALHLETRTQRDVRKYSHDLVKAYKALPQDKQTLVPEELALLERANEIYRAKDFEYFCVADACIGFTRYPELEALGNLTRKVTGYQGG